MSLRPEEEIREALKEVEKYYKKAREQHCSHYMASTARDILSWMLYERDHFEYSHGKVY